MPTVSVTRYHLPALVLVVLGALVAAYGGSILYGVEEDTYTYEVFEADEDRIGDREVRQFTDLSPAEQDVFEEARAADGPYETTENPPGFESGGDAANEYFVEYGGEIYELRAWGGHGPLDGLAVWFGYAFVGAGLVLACAFAASVILERPLYPTASLVGGALGGAALLAGATASVILLAVLLGTAATWGALRTRVAAD